MRNIYNFFRIDCPMCDGTGEIVGDNCALCKGTGKERNYIILLIIVFLLLIIGFIIFL